MYISILFIATLTGNIHVWQFIQVHPFDLDHPLLFLSHKTPKFERPYTGWLLRKTLWEKEKMLVNQHFLLFPQCFLSRQRWYKQELYLFCSQQMY